MRVYDGNIQWFDGEKWLNLGFVEQYQEKYPFLAYEQEKTELLQIQEKTLRMGRMPKKEKRQLLQAVSMTAREQER